ncbi:MAG: AsmA family protein [Acetobacteraceae bacterium]
MTTAPRVQSRRRRRIRRTILVVIATLVVVPLAAIAVFIARFDPNAYKPAIAAAVERATGRELRLGGPLSLGISLVPTIAAANVALANPPGFSRPDLARLARLKAKVALLPLLAGRIEIRSLVLIRPTIALEINRDGASNFFFAPPAKAGPVATPAVPSTPAATPPGTAKPVAIEVRAFVIKDGTLSWQDDRSGRHETLLLHSFSATSASADAPVALAAQASYDGTSFTLRGTSGPLSRLRRAGSGAPWPLTLTVAAGPAEFALAGSLTDPLAARGYRFHIHATVPQLAEFAPLLPGARLPALAEVVLSADFADTGNGRPRVSDLSLAAGPSDLAALRPGLQLAGLSFVAPRLDQPCKLTLNGTLGGAHFDLSATLGPLESLLPPGLTPPPPAAPWPLAVRATAAGAVLSLSGTLARPAELAGGNLAASAQIPALAKLEPFVGVPLPALSQIHFSGQIADAESGWRQWVRLSALSLTLPQGDLAGDASVRLAGARPALTASLTSKELDLDALRTAFRPTHQAPRAAPTQATPGAAPPMHAAHVIPDTPLPFALLKTADADIRFSVGKLIANRTSYSNVDGKVSLQNGKLVLAPLSADAPGGHVALTASVDAAAAPPPVALTFDAPALALSPLLAAFGLPARASGTLAVRAEVKGAGNSPHAIAAGLDGQLGVAMAGGSVDNRSLAALFGPVLRTARVPQELLSGGESTIRCLALRLDATGGTATLRAGLLEMAPLILTATGSLALGPETLALQATPMVQLRNNTLTLPVRVGGTFRRPSIAPEASGAARSAAGLVGGLIKPESELGRILDALRGKAAPAAPDCAPALALARFGAPGPAAPPAAKTPAPQPSAPSKPPSPLNLLRGLFH